MTHVPAYYRARRDAERAWRATHPQYVIPGLLDALDEPVESRINCGPMLPERALAPSSRDGVHRFVECVVSGDGPPSGCASGQDVAATYLPPGAVPPSHGGSTDGAEPGYRQVGTDGNPSSGADGSSVAADDLGQSASAPIQTTGPGRTPPKEVRGQGQGGHPK